MKKDGAPQRRAALLARGERIVVMKKDGAPPALRAYANEDGRKENAPQRLRALRAFVNENRFRLIPGSLSLTSYEIAAFKAFNLDPAAPGDLRILVRYLAFVLFGRRRAGPRRKWTYDQLFNLYKEYEAFKARCPEMKDVEICGLLAGTGKYPSGRSGRSDAGTIRRKLQDARRYCVTVEKVLDQRIREALKSSS